MKTKKIRGHKRIWKNIDQWKNANLNLDLDNLKSQGRDYVKIWVHPYSGLSLTHSHIPQPKAETKTRILTGLLDIYENWKTQLDALNNPYYLKIWLYEPRFSKSQVVCAIGDYINYYQNMFIHSENIKASIGDYPDSIKNRMIKFTWQQRLDEEFLDNTEIGYPEDFPTKNEYLENKKWFYNELKKPHRKIIFKEPIGDATESYAFKIGHVWIGEH